MDMRISVVGTGYLGATHAACLAELGFEVVGVDNDREKVARLGRGSLPFSEPGLQEMVGRHVSSGRLRFTTDIREAAAFADVHFICVGTPQVESGLAADVGAVFAAARELARHVTRDCLIVGKSTVPVGTAAVLADEVEDLVPHRVTASVAWNPEFLREGHAVSDTLRPERLVFGVSTPEAELTLRRVYEEPITAGVRVHVVDMATAELAKVSANAFLATKISFINAMSEVSDRVGANVVALADILGEDPRIGRRFLDAGIGFGGGCLPKDIRAFSARAEELGVPAVARLLTEVDEINLRARRRTVELTRRLCGSRLRGRRVAVLGAAFKPLSDDVRDSPALHIAAKLHSFGAAVRVYDPEASANARAVFPSLTYARSVETALAGADVVLHLTDWPEFTKLDPSRAAELVRRRQIIDGRSQLDEERWRMAGWTFHGLGRGTHRPLEVAQQRRSPDQRTGYAWGTQLEWI
jgi:UDPglucose 6-dehydrogenase